MKQPHVSRFELSCLGDVCLSFQQKSNQDDPLLSGWLEKLLCDLLYYPKFWEYETMPFVIFVVNSLTIIGKNLGLFHPLLIGSISLLITFHPYNWRCFSPPTKRNGDFGPDDKINIRLEATQSCSKPHPWRIPMGVIYLPANLPPCCSHKN